MQTTLKANRLHYKLYFMPKCLKRINGLKNYFTAVLTYQLPVFICHR